MKMWKKTLTSIITALLTISMACAPVMAETENQKTLFGEVILEETESGPIVEGNDIMLLSEYTGNRDWKWPVPDSNMLSSCYLDGRSHYALDIAAPKDTRIYASYPGTVIATSMACSHNYGKSGSCGCNGGMGNYIFIRHNYNGVDFVTRYIHLTKVNVSVGNQVTKDTVIGTVGSTGSSRGFHLDFRIYQGAEKTSSKSTCVDPLKDQFLEMPEGLNANGASTSCCYTYVEEVKKIYAIPLETEETQPPVDEDGLAFIDVPSYAWYYDAVKYVYENKIMSGITATTFGPAEVLTRSQFASMLYRLEGSPEVTFESRFSDVAEGHWYTNAVIWANNENIVSGYADSALFGPEDYITREQIAAMMFRYATYKGYDVLTTGSFEHFADADEVSEYAVHAIEWAVGSGIISGKDAETLAPLGNTYRAECASIFMRFMKLYNEMAE